MANKYQVVNLEEVLCGSKGLASSSPIKLNNSGYKGYKINNVENVDGIDWYQYMVPNERYFSLIDKVGQNEINQKFIVCVTIPNLKDKNRPNRRFAAFNSVLDFLHYIKDVPRERWVFFEYIMGDQVQKLYFDIDTDVGKLVEVGIINIPEDPNHCRQQLDIFSRQLISSLVGRIITVFNQRGHTIDIAKQILIFNSNSTTKRSYHVVVDGYAVSNCDENSALAQEILKPFPDYIFKKRIIDDLYSSKQQFRLFQSQKPGSNRPKVFVDKWYYGDDLIEYQYPEISVPDEITQNALRFTTLFQASCVTYIDACKIIAIVPPNENSTGKNSRRNKLWTETGTFDELDETPVTEDIIDAICQRVDPKMFDIYRLERDKIAGPFIALNRKGNLIGTEVMCTLCDRTHKSIGAFLRVNKYGKVHFYCYGTEGLSKVVADISDLLPSNKELEINQKQSILNQLKGHTSPSIKAAVPSPITLHSQMRTMAANSNIF